MESYYTAAAYRKEKVTQGYLFCFKNKQVICVCMSSMSLLDIIVRGLSVTSELQGLAERVEPYGHYINHNLQHSSSYNDTWDSKWQ